MINNLGIVTCDQKSDLSILSGREGEMGNTNSWEADVFSYRITKDGKIFISWYGKHVKTLQGKAVKTFITKIDGADTSGAQLIMAKVTGNFKRGNEKRNRNDELELMIDG